MKGPAKHGRVTVGHPVDVASGEFTESVVDFAISGAVPLELERHYAAPRATPSPLQPARELRQEMPLGYGWRLGFSAELRQTLAGFTYTAPTGAEFLFGATGPIGAGTRLYCPEDGLELRFTDANRAHIIGYSEGREPHSLVFTRWGAASRFALTSVEATPQARLDVTRDEYGRVTSLHQTREGRSLLFHYASDRLVRVDLQLPDRTSRDVATYRYDTYGLLAGVYDRDGLVESYTYDASARMIRKESRDGSTYAIRYNGRGRCIYVAGSDRYEECTLVYDEPGQRTWVTDSHGETTRYEWNERGQVVRLTSPLGRELRYEFDELGRPVRESLPKRGLIESEYDAIGHLVKMTLPGGITAKYFFDDEHHLVREEVSDGTVNEAAYDQDHNRVSISADGDRPWTYRYNAFGEQTEVRNPLGEVATTVYDNLGNITYESNFKGVGWTYTVNALGQATSVSNALGQTESVEYDARDRPAVVISADGSRLLRTYDIIERTETTTGPDGRWERKRYSYCGNLTEVSDSDGYVVRLHWTTEPGQLQAIENTRGERTEFLYDPDHRLIGERTFDGRMLRLEYAEDLLSASIDAAGNRTEYDFDARGLIKERRAPDGTSKYEHDVRGLLTRAVTPESTLTLRYDRRGLPIEEEVDGIVVRRTVDELGRPTSLGTSLGDETRFSWGPNTELRSLTRGATTVTFEYDLLGQEIRRHLPIGVFEQTYNVLGGIASQALRQTPTTTTPMFWRTFTYDVNERTTSIVDSLRGRTLARHDSRGNLRAILNPDGSGEFYEFDGEGNRLVQLRTPRGQEIFGAFERTGLQDSNALLHRFGGNIERSSVGEGNRLTRIRSETRDIEYEYDANGCVVHKVVVEGAMRREWRFTWNSRLQMTSATLPDGQSWSYRYDPCGRRIEKRGPTGEVFRFVWDGNRVLNVLKDQQLVESFSYLPDETCPVIRQTTSIQFGFPDGTGTLSELVDSTGEIFMSRRGTWGDDFAGAQQTHLDPLRAQWLDDETGLHYNVYRYYDPDGCRFLSPDPVGISGGLNAYVAITSPLTEADDWGLVREGKVAVKGNAERTKPREETIKVKNRSGEKVETQRGSVRDPDGKAVSMRGNTACERFDGKINDQNLDDKRNVSSRTTLNGRESPSAEAMHAEIRAMAFALGADVKGLKKGKGPVSFVISRAPCDECMKALGKLKADLKRATGRTINLYWPPWEEDKKGKRKPNRLTPKCD